MSPLATIVSQQKSNMANKEATTESTMSLDEIHKCLTYYEQILDINSDMPLYVPRRDSPSFDNIPFDKSEAGICARMGNVHRRIAANNEKAVDSWIHICNLKDNAKKELSDLKERGTYVPLAEFLKTEEPHRRRENKKWESLSKQFHSSLAVKQFHVITKWGEVHYIRAGDEAIPAEDGLSTSQVTDKATEKGIGSQEVNAFITTIEDKLGLPKVNYDGSKHAKDVLAQRYKAVENALPSISHPVRKVELMRLFYNSPEVALIAAGNQIFREKQSAKVNAVESLVTHQIVIPTVPMEKNPQVKERVWGAKEDTPLRLNLCKNDKKRKRNNEASQVGALNGNSLPAEDSCAEKRQRVNTKPRSADFTI